MLGLYRIVFKLLSAAAGCEVHGSALSAEKILDVPQHDSDPFLPPALPTDFSLIFATKPAWKSVLAKVHALIRGDLPRGAARGSGAMVRRHPIFDASCACAARARKMARMATMKMPAITA